MTPPSSDNQTIVGGELPILKGCPFCGGEADLRDPHGAFSRLAAVYCDECEIRGPLASSDYLAIAAWNARAPAPEAAEVIRQCVEALTNARGTIHASFCEEDSEEDEPERSDDECAAGNPIHILECREITALLTKIKSPEGAKP